MKNSLIIKDERLNMETKTARMTISLHQDLMNMRNVVRNLKIHSGQINTSNIKMQITLLLLMATTQASTIFPAEAEKRVEYKNASVTPIFWNEDGTPWVLLGKEKRRKEGTVWCDFFGRKDKKDKGNPLITAKREALEESAEKLELLGDPLYRYHGKKNKSTVHFIWKTEYIDPKDIHASATALQGVGKGHHIEKTDWQWVKLEELLNEETGLKLHWSLADKLKHPSMGPFFKSLLEGKVESDEEEEECTP